LFTLKSRIHNGNLNHSLVTNDRLADTDTRSFTRADWLANASISRTRGGIYSFYDGAVWSGEIVASCASDQGIVLSLCFQFSVFIFVIFIFILRRVPFFFNVVVIYCCTPFKFEFRNPSQHYGLSAAALFGSKKITLVLVGWIDDVVLLYSLRGGYYCQ
jgi:hypothetical protein